MYVAISKEKIKKLIKMENPKRILKTESKIKIKREEHV